MRIDKQQVVELLKSRGDHAQAGQAEQSLPGQVDTDQHADLLGQLGIDPAELLGGAGGRLGDLGGKLGL